MKDKAVHLRREFGFVSSVRRQYGAGVSWCATFEQNEGGKTIATGGYWAWKAILITIIWTSIMTHLTFTAKVANNPRTSSAEEPPTSLIRWFLRITLNLTDLLTRHQVQKTNRFIYTHSDRMAHL